MADAHGKAEAPQAAAAAASDPEEDDLSDLDDVLDEFASTKLESKPAPAAASHPPSDPAQAPKDTKADRPDPAELLVQDEDAFAKELQKEMEQLLGQGDFKEQFEAIMKEMGDATGADPTAAGQRAAPGPASAPTSGADARSDPSEETFQESIRKTMERMQASGDAASAAASSAGQDDILAQMLKEMESGNLGGDGNDEDFSKVLMGMMEQLTHKEILYEPMKELNDKFPKWMEENKGKVKEEDWKRYTEQQVLVKEITERFELPKYSDDNVQDREYIAERMQKMQAAGSPPPDLVGDMNAAQDALNGLDEGCPTQ